MAKLPIFYRKSSEAIISFSFTDILSKTGYVTFYGLNQYKAAAAVYSLSPIKTSSFLMQKIQMDLGFGQGVEPTHHKV